MSGLDPIGRASVRRLILDLKSEGKTVFFSTHILTDAEALCDRVAILRRGKVVSEGALSEILQISVEHLEVTCAGLSEQFAGFDGATLVHRSGRQARLHVDEAALFGFIREVEKQGGHILTVQPQRRSLEEVFVEEVQGSAPEGRWDA
jgi:ABC-2 type transport system ATP-binding protein